MTDRDRLAADLETAFGIDGPMTYEADRLIALGWTRLLPSVDRDIIAEHDRIVAANAPLDEGRLARALNGTVVWAGPPVIIDRESSAAAIAKAYREDGDA